MGRLQRQGGFLGTLAAAGGISWDVYSGRGDFLGRHSGRGDFLGRLQQQGGFLGTPQRQGGFAHGDSVPVGSGVAVASPGADVAYSEGIGSSFKKRSVSTGWLSYTPVTSAKSW